MKKIRSLALFALALLALFAIGCGSSDSSDSSAEALSKADYIAQGNAICKAGNDELAAAAKEIGSNPSKDQIIAYGNDTLIPNLEDQAASLRALGTPEGDEDTVNAIYDALDKGIAAVKADPAVLVATDDPFSEANDLAAAYGLSGCAG